MDTCTSQKVNTTKFAVFSKVLKESMVTKD